MNNNKNLLNHLIRKVKLVDNIIDKKQILQQITEILLKENSLLQDNFGTLANEFQYDKSPLVLKWLISILEEVCLKTSSIEYVFSCLDVFIRLSTHESKLVIKSVIITTNNIFQKVLQLIASDPNKNSPLTLSMWKNLRQLQENILKNIRNRNVGSESIIIYTLKFIETIILSFSSGHDLPKNSEGITFFHLELIPSNHFILHTNELKAEGEKWFMLFLDQWSSIQENSSTHFIPINYFSTSIACVMLNSLALIARQRIQFLVPVVNFFSNLQRRPPNFPHFSKQIDSINHALKIAIFSLLRSSYLANCTELIDCLKFMGANEQASQLQARINSYTAAIQCNNDAEKGNKRTSDILNSSNEDVISSTLKKKKEPLISNNESFSIPNSQNNFTPLTNINMPNISQPNVAEFLLTNFSFETIVEIIIESMNYLPPPPPVPVSEDVFQQFLIRCTQPIITPHSPPVPSLISNPPVYIQSNVARLDPRRDPRLQTKSSEGISNISLNSLNQSSSSLEIPIPKVSDLESDISKTKEKKNILEKKKSITIPSIVSTSSPPSILSKIPQFNNLDYDNLIYQSFYRILNNEKGSEIGGKAHLRRYILVKMIIRFSNSQISKQLEDLLMKNILENFKERKELAITWLFQEYINEIAFFFKNDNNKNNNEYSVPIHGRYYQLLMSFVSFLQQSNEKDKLFSWLLLEAPYLFDEIFTIIQQYCEQPNTTRMGLAICRDIIINRPFYREKALHLLLQFTNYKNEEIRSPAIRLVTNKLFCLNIPLITNIIEDFARNLMFSVVSFQVKEFEKKESSESSESSESKENKDTMDEIKNELENGKFLSEDEIKRYLFLYFALCTKKHELLSGIVEFYIQSSSSIKHIIHQQSTGLIRAIGDNSPQFLQLLSNFPRKSEPLILHFLHILTEGGKPSQQFINIIKSTYKKTLDPRFLIPILPNLDKEEISEILPKLINLPSNILKNALIRLLKNSNFISPSELLVSLHLIDTKDANQLKKVIEATQFCFEQKSIFKQEVLAIVLQQLLDMNPIPPLFMRTVIQTIAKYPKLMSFIMEILSRLIGKQVWNDKRLWEGFIKCCKMTQPHSFLILLQLPVSQLENTLHSSSELKEAFLEWQKKQNLQK